MKGTNAIGQRNRAGSINTPTVSRLLFLLLGLAFCVAPICAQERYLSGLIGTVSDTTGAKIVGATVTATDDTTQFVTKATTDKAGSVQHSFSHAGHLHGYGAGQRVSYGNPNRCCANR